MTGGASRKSLLAVRDKGCNQNRQFPFREASPPWAGNFNSGGNRSDGQGHPGYAN